MQNLSNPNINYHQIHVENWKYIFKPRRIYVQIYSFSIQSPHYRDVCCSLCSTHFRDLTFFKNFSIIYSCLVSTQSKMYAYVKNLWRYDIFLTEYSFHTQKGCYDYKANHSKSRWAQSFLHSVHCYLRYLAGRQANL